MDCALPRILNPKQNITHNDNEFKEIIYTNLNILMVSTGSRYATYFRHLLTIYIYMIIIYN